MKTSTLATVALWLGITASFAARAGSTDSVLPADSIRAVSPRDDSDQWRFYASADVLPFINGGYSAFVDVKPRGVKHWAFGATVFAFNAPSFMTTLLDSGNTGFGARYTAAALNVAYFFGPDPLPAWRPAQTRTHGLFVAGLLGARLTTISRADTWGLSSNLTNLLAGAMFGELWFPFGKYLYLMPAIGVATAPLVAGYTTIGGHIYTEPPIMPLIILPVGIQF